MTWVAARLPRSPPPRHPRERGDPSGASDNPPHSLQRHPRECGDPSGASNNPPRSLQSSSSRTRGSKRSLRQPTALPTTSSSRTRGSKRSPRQPTALPTNVILANAGTHFDVGLPPQNPLHQPLRRPICLIPTLRSTQSRQRIHRYLLAHLHPPLIKGVDVPDH